MKIVFTIFALLLIGFVLRSNMPTKITREAVPLQAPQGVLQSVGAWMFGRAVESADWKITDLGIVKIASAKVMDREVRLVGLPFVGWSY